MYESKAPLGGSKKPQGDDFEAAYCVSQDVAAKADKSGIVNFKDMEGCPLRLFR